MKDKKINKPLSNLEEYQEFAEWCNENNYIIKETNDYYYCEKIIMTNSELKNSRILSLKQLLSETDYIISKLSELQMQNSNSYASELARYQETLNNRSSWRSELNLLMNE